MRGLAAMLGKEWLELARSWKWLWVPLVFILLGIMQPVSYYFLPQLLDAAGNLPEGAVISIPLPSGGEILAGTLEQYGIFGALIIALSFMGAVSQERNTGTGALILVKPVSPAAFVLSKWLAMAALVAASLAAGYAASWYYTVVLIGPVAVGNAMAGAALYALWLLVVGSSALMFSALWKSPAAAAFSALGTFAALALLTSLFPRQLAWSPGRLPAASRELLLEGAAGSLWPTVAVTALCVIGSVLIAVRAVRAHPAD
ncbi:ABC transporter permease [Paenibacillus cisolokensis]|nr:ABC transporter permease subunit [Paenibacillus cisolokensis]